MLQELLINLIVGLELVLMRINGLLLRIDIYRYFCRIKESIITKFMEKHKLTDMEDALDEFIFQNSYQLNKNYYSSLGEKRAFVLSHGKNQLVFKAVSYADQTLRYYKLEEMKAHLNKKWWAIILEPTTKYIEDFFECETKDIGSIHFFVKKIEDVISGRKDNYITSGNLYALDIEPSKTRIFDSMDEEA